MTRASDTAKLLGAGATILDGTTISTADNTAQLTLTSTDADSNFGPLLTMYRNSSSPADADFLGDIEFQGENSAGETITYAQVFGRTVDVTDGTEDGRIAIKTMRAGASRSALDISATEIIFNDDSEDVDFRVESDNLTHALFVDGASGRVGIGASNNGDYHANNDDLLIATTGSTGMTIASGTSDQGRIAFADGTSDNADEVRGLIMYNHNGNVMSFNVNASEVFRAGANNVGIFSTQATARLNIESNLTSFTTVQLKNNNSNNSGVFLQCVDDGGGGIGGITQNGNTAIAFNTSSDYRLKENVSYSFDATTRVKQLKPCRFNFIKDKTDTAIDGFLAHEVSDIVPTAITGDKDVTEDIGTVKDADGNIVDSDATELQFTERKKDEVYTSDYTWTKTTTREVHQQIDHSKLVPLLVKTIQELEARITALES